MPAGCTAAPCKSVCTTVFSAVSPAALTGAAHAHIWPQQGLLPLSNCLTKRCYVPDLHSRSCRWLTQLLRTSRLDALMVKHVEMSTEIKSLDSDMQMLVYENYNKFISATDTIRSMKSNVDGMDSNMHELKGLIGQWAAGNVVLDCEYNLKAA